MNQTMMLLKAVAEKKDAVLQRWLGLVADTYPSGATFFKKEDRFANPVGYTFTAELGVLLEEFSEGRTRSERVIEALGNITRVTAVQDFSPGEAVAFVFLLKQAIKDELKGALRAKEAREQMTGVESSIDGLALMAFNAYVECRERLNQARVNEVKAAKDDAFRLLDRMVRKYEKAEAE